MPITKSPIDSIFRKPTTGIYIPLLNLNAVNPVNPIAAAITRVFTPLLGSGSQRYTFNTITLDADFEIEVDFATTSTVNFNMILGKIGSADDFLAIRDGNRITGRFDGSGVNLINHVVDGKLTTLNIKRTSGTIVTTIGDSTNTVTNSNTFEIDILGAYNTNSFSFTGYLANAKVYKESDLVIDAPIDKQYTAAAPTVINKADSNNNLTAVNLDNAATEFTASDDYGWLGQNEVGSPDRIGSDWTNNGDGSFTIDTPDGNINNCNLRFSSLSTSSRYLVELTVTAPVGSDKLRLRDCTPNVDYETAGNFADIVIPFNNNAPSFNRVTGQSFVQTISNISNRQVLEIAGVSQ
jgi:hypothetical protein